MRDQYLQGKDTAGKETELSDFSVGFIAERHWLQTNGSTHMYTCKINSTQENSNLTKINYSF